MGFGGSYSDQFAFDSEMNSMDGNFMQRVGCAMAVVTPSRHDCPTFEVVGIAKRSGKQHMYVGRTSRWQIPCRV